MKRARLKEKNRAPRGYCSQSGAGLDALSLKSALFGSTATLIIQLSGKSGYLFNSESALPWTDRCPELHVNIPMVFISAGCPTEADVVL